MHMQHTARPCPGVRPESAEPEAPAPRTRAAWAARAAGRVSGRGSRVVSALRGAQRALAIGLSRRRYRGVYYYTRERNATSNTHKTEKRPNKQRNAPAWYSYK